MIALSSRGIGRALTLLGLLLLLGGCRGRDKSRTLVLWHQMNPGERELLSLQIEEFERLHPEYEVIMGTSAVRDVTGDPTRFLLGVAGGLPPDVIVFDRFAVVEWASRGAFQDLSPYLQQALNQDDPIRAENYYEAAWAETKLDDKVYAIPSTFDTRAMYYHKDPLIRRRFLPVRC